MSDPALATQLHQVLVLSLYDDILFQRRSVLLEDLLQHAHAVRPNVPVFNLRKIDGGKSAHLYLLYYCL